MSMDWPEFLTEAPSISRMSCHGKAIKPESGLEVDTWASHLLYSLAKLQGLCARPILYSHSALKLSLVWKESLC